MSLIRSVLRGEIEVVRAEIKQSPVGIDSFDKDGRTALIHAVIERRLDIVLLLLENGADPNVQDKSGNAPLHFATQGYEPEIAALLLANGAEVDALDQNGNTPLSNAVFNSQGNGELISLLVKNGADRELKNAYGVSPLDLAKSIGNYDVTKFLD